MSEFEQEDEDSPAVEAPEGAEGDEASDETAGAAADETAATEAEAAAEAEREQNLRLIEALLFASAEPVSERSLAGRLPKGTRVRELLHELQARYANRGVNLFNAGSTWAMRTAPDLAARLSVEGEVQRKLSRAAIETLAVIAYHQPVTRAEIEEIRGVALSKGTLDALLEAGWIRLKGRKEAPGRPVMWGTTDAFLHHFGLEKLEDLPGLEELKAAGLLDTRPAIAAYAARGELAPAEEGGAGGTEEGGEALVPPPLDPDDDAEAAEAAPDEADEESFETPPSIGDEPPGEGLDDLEGIEEDDRDRQAAAAGPHDGT
jgi:segregation and condensation protein B